MTLTKIVISEDEKTRAAMSAYRITMSPHEWQWSQADQEAMASYILFLSAELVRATRVAEKAAAYFALDSLDNSHREFWEAEQEVRKALRALREGTG